VTSEVIGKRARIGENEIVVYGGADDNNAYCVVTVFVNAVFRCDASRLRGEDIKGGCRCLFVAVVI